MQINQSDNKKIPFEITTDDPFYSEKNLERLKKAVLDIDKGKGKGKGTKHDIIEVKDE